MRSRLLTFAVLATLAPLGRTGGHVRGPFGRRPVRNADGDGGTSSSTGEKGSTGTADKGAEGDASKTQERMLPQSEVNAIAAKERRAAEAKAVAAQKQLEEVNARLAAYEEERRQAEEAKLSAAQRQELEQKRLREGYEKRIAELDTSAKKERELRHTALKAQKAASLAGSVAQKLYSDKALPFIEQTIASRLVIEVGDDGAERVVLRMGAPGDHEPLETGWPKLLDAEIAPAFFRQQEGTGASHGRGTSRGGNGYTTPIAAFEEAFTTKK